LPDKLPGGEILLTDYHEIEKACIKQNELSQTFVDDFLIYFCAQREGLDRLFAKKLGQYRSIVQKMPEGWPFWIMSQYTAFRLFRKNGFAKQYMGYSEILRRSDDEKALLSFQIANPWRFAFCSIRSNPATHFFEMVDVLTNEQFLLYSSGLTESLEQHGPMQMYFYLIGFNGQCWQTYGPLAYLRGIIPADLLFFARQLDPDVLFMNQIPDLIDRDPLPWALLWRSGEIPLSFHKDDMVIMNCSEYHEEEFEPDQYEDAFKIERKFPLYKMSLKRWDRPPHFAACFYHKKKNRLILSAMTDRGYEKLIEQFSKMGYELPASAENRVTLTMLYTVKEVLGRDIQINPYEKSFSEPENQHSEELEKINIFLKFLMDAHNADKEIDIEQFATLAGIDSENAHTIAEQTMKTLDKMPKGKDRKH
jgi:hypothetical protein